MPRKEVDATCMNVGIDYWRGTISLKPEPLRQPAAPFLTESKGGTGPPKQPCPLRTVTRPGAQVAPQQSLILRTGARDIITIRQKRPIGAQRFRAVPHIGFALFGPCGAAIFEAFSALCYRVASRLEEVLSTRSRVEAFITISAGFCRLRSW